MNGFLHWQFWRRRVAGGARRVVQLTEWSILHLAKDIMHGKDFPSARVLSSPRFFSCRRSSTLSTTFVGVVDPPFFSSTAKGRVDQKADSARLISKVRPLIKDGGYLIAINNALYVSGREFMQTLESLCRDGYLKIEELIPVPEDFVGFNKIGTHITDPAPFNHSTKIVVLKVKKKIIS